MTIGNLLYTTNDHERRDINGQESIGHDSKNGRDEERHYHDTQEFPDFLPHSDLKRKKEGDQHNRPPYNGLFDVITREYPH